MNVVATELRGVDVPVEPLESVRRMRMEGLDGHDDHLGSEVMDGGNFGGFYVGDCMGAEGQDEFCPSRLKIPGSLCPDGRMALKICVTIVATALRAFWASSKVALEWPVE